MGTYEDSVAAFRSGDAGRAEELALELHDGHFDRARELFSSAVELARAGHYDALEPYLLLDAAFVALEDGDRRRAAQLAAAMQAALLAAGQIPDPDDAAEQDLLQSRLREL